MCSLSWNLWCCFPFINCHVLLCLSATKTNLPFCLTRFSSWFPSSLSVLLAWLPGRLPPDHAGGVSPGTAARGAGRWGQRVGLLLPALLWHHHTRSVHPGGRRLSYCGHQDHQDDTALHACRDLSGCFGGNHSSTIRPLRSQKRLKNECLCFGKYRCNPTYERVTFT